MSTPERMTAAELRTAVTLAAAFFLRMTGLFMVLPVLALYAHTLRGATPLYVGLALGLYGFSQATLQIPFGRWSDRIGRKPVIAVGLLIFSVGGLIAGCAEHIFTVILGRTLQGAGAVSGATLALAADLTRPEQRTKTMAIIGISIGAAFSLAFVIGPIIDAHFGLHGVFFAGAISGVGALLLILFAVPKAPPMQAIVVTAAADTSHELRALYFGVLCLHLILSASFVAIPVLLVQEVGLPKTEHYTVYLPALLGSLILIGPLLGRSHRGNLTQNVFPAAIACLLVAECLLGGMPMGYPGMLATLTLFFVGFNFLEASLPSMISRVAPTSNKGAALGTYSTGQFVGTFLGGVLGGSAASVLGNHGVFALAGAVALLWLLLIQHPRFALGARRALP